jgi:hypothetical protein
VEIPNEVKAKIIEGRIEGIRQEMYAHSIDHEVQAFLGRTERAAEIEKGIAEGVRAIQFLNKKLEELRAIVPNGKEPVRIDGG